MNPRAFKNNARASVLAIGLAVLFAQPGGNAQAPPISLPFSNSYLITGNYVVGSVDLQGGSIEGVINMEGVPPNAVVLSAFLYWEMILADPVTPAQLTAPPKFRGETINMADVEVVKTSDTTLSGPTASCFSSGGGQGAVYRMYKLRADVRKLLPLQVGGNKKSTGKRLVNNEDLLGNLNAAGAPSPLPLHKFTAPERSGNQLPQTAGASLVVIYRDVAEPLRKILLYDGIAVMPDLPLARLLQPIRGIYQSDTSNKSARLTHI